MAGTKRCSCVDIVICTGLVLGIVLVATGVVLFYELDPIIRDQVKQRVIISNTSETYDIWQDIPIPVYMQFWVFDVQNVADILAGGKPIVKQKGPYTYRERREKFDIVWNANGTVTYKQNRTFHFVPEMSSESDEEPVTTVNPLLPVIAEGLKYMPGVVKDVIATVFKIPGIKEDLFFTRPVREVLFGYEDEVLKLCQTFLPKYFDTTVIGYFMRRNYTDDGVYTVHTGAKNISILGVIDKYNGGTHLDLWTTEYANMVNGTDGSLGPPFRFDDKYSPVFVSDICRSIRGLYTKDVYVKDILLHRFAGDRIDMANATVNPDNIGFCTPQTSCLPTGLLNSTLCQEPVDHFDLPIIFSFPHFLFADPEVQNSVDGISPNESEHQTVIDAEPWTGLVLRVAKRLQINIYVEQVPGISQTANVRTLFFPIVWLNESSVVDDKYADMLKDELFTPKELAEVGRIVAVAVGSVLFVLCLILFVRRRRKLAKQRGSYDVSQHNGYNSQRSPLLRSTSSHEYDYPVIQPIVSNVSITPRDQRANSTRSANSYGSVISTDTLHSIPEDSRSTSPQSIISNKYYSPGPSQASSPQNVPESTSSSLPANSPGSMHSLPGSVTTNNTMHSLPNSYNSGPMYSPQSNSSSMYSLPQSDTSSTKNLLDA